VPRITHGLTETACVGLSEDEARASGAEIEVRSMQLSGVAKGLMLGEPGMVKVVAEKDGSILGVHMAGPHVSEMIGEGVALTDFQASPAEAALVHGHPTLSEALSELNLALAGRALHHR
jgi:dihydrolipoamide dehydrogenase